MSVHRSRLARLEARHRPQRGCLTLRDVGTGELAEFVASNHGSAGERWTQRHGESLDDLAARIEAESGVRWLIMVTHPDRPVRCDLEIQRTYGRGTRSSTRIYMPDNGRDR